MHLYEYQAMAILNEYGIGSAKAVVVSSLDEVDCALRELGSSKLWVKAQVPTGERAKAGAVALASSSAEAKSLVEEMLHKVVVTEQTGKKGATAKRVLLAIAEQVESEFYLAATIDWHRRCSVLLFSAQGGTEVEKRSILKIDADFNRCLSGEKKALIARFMGWSGAIATAGEQIVTNLMRAFNECDASLIEINPLALSEDRLIALDAKMTIDENALFRQPRIANLCQEAHPSVEEAKARAINISYIPLEGTIGCIVNGAGLAMATVDMIKHYGGRAANFLDIGGGAIHTKIAESFTLLKSLPIRVVLLNIFGGITDCVALAKAVVESQPSTPLIIRMEGTNAKEGREILKKSDLTLLFTSSLAEAVKKAVAVESGYFS